MGRAGGSVAPALRKTLLLAAYHPPCSVRSFPQSILLLPVLHPPCGVILLLAVTVLPSVCPPSCDVPSSCGVTILLTVYHPPYRIPSFLQCTILPAVYPPHGSVSSSRQCILLLAVYHPPGRIPSFSNVPSSLQWTSFSLYTIFPTGPFFLQYTILLEAYHAFAGSRRYCHVPSPLHCTILLILHHPPFYLASSLQCTILIRVYIPSRQCAIIIKLS